MGTRYGWSSCRSRTSELALARVASRVAAGGHDVPEETVRRRFTAGLRYFFTLYRHRVDEWALYDNEAGGPVLIGSGDRHGEHVLDSTMFDRLRARSSATSRSNDGKLKP